MTAMTPRLIAILLTLLLCLPGAVAAQAQPPTLADYERLLREAQAAAMRGDRLDLEQVAPALTAAESVQLPDGRLAPVDNRWLAEALDTANPDLPAIAERLGALIDALAYAGPAAPADAQQRLADLLSRPPFEQPAPPREPTLIDRFFQWLGEWLADLLQPVGEVAATTDGDLLSWGLVIIGGLLVAAVLAIWLRGLRRTLASDPQTLADDEEERLSAGEALGRANSLAQRGDYRTAVRYLYLSSLLWLDERRMLRYDRTLTNREYLTRLGERPDLRERLTPVVETFDRVWYGAAPLDAERFAAYEQQVARLRELEERQ